MIFILWFMKIYQLLKKLLEIGTHRKNGTINLSFYMKYGNYVKTASYCEISLC
jgi:hypothetical protein